jgi:hypothetical protein
VPVNWRIGSAANVGNVNTYNFSWFYANAQFTPAGNIVTISNSDHNLGNSVTANVFTGNLTTGDQPNITSVGNLTSLTVTGISTLGNVGNVKITGGSNAQVLTTDGTGNLTWETPSGGGGGDSISNGTSNVSIATANGNVTVSVNGTSDVIVVSNTIANINDIRTRSNVVVLGNNASVSAANLIAIGPNARAASFNSSLAPSIAIGPNANASSNGIAIGGGTNLPDGGGIAIGTNSGLFINGGIAIGVGTTGTGLNPSGMAIGSGARTRNGLSIGRGAGGAPSAGASGFGSGQGTTLIGFEAGFQATSLGDNIVLLGGQTARNSPSFGTNSIGIGFSAGQSTTVGARSILIGFQSGLAGANVVGSQAVLLGTRAGAAGGGEDAIAIGTNAGWGPVAMGNNSITLNGTGANLAATTANTFVVKPVRQLTAANVMYYSPTSGEISYDTTANITAVGTLSTLSVSGDANVGNLSVAGNTILSANLEQSGGDPVAATDTTIAFKIPIVINGNTYYISLTAAQ